MAFRRAQALGERPDAASLTKDMVGVGMNFGGTPNVWAPIEDTLVHASALGMDDDDLRVLAVLTTWLGVHHARLNADRLLRAVSQDNSERVRGYWSAIGQWLSHDRRFARLSKLHSGTRVDLLHVGTNFQVARNGEDERFAGTALRAPATTLRDRPADVLAPAVLARRHAGYRNRVLLGPTWRADVWTALERDPDLSAAEAARQARCGFATAWQAVADFRLVQGVSAKPQPESVSIPLDAHAG